MTKNDPRVKNKEFATMGKGAKSGRIGYASKKIEEEKKVLELQKKNEAF